MSPPRKGAKGEILRNSNYSFLHISKVRVMKWTPVFTGVVTLAFAAANQQQKIERIAGLEVLVADLIYLGQHVVHPLMAD